jgi:small GTP-binding protein
LLTHIFLFKGKNFQDLDQLNIYGYPNEIITIDNKTQISKIIYGHDHGDLIHKYRNHKANGNSRQVKSNKNHLYLIDTPVPQRMNDLNIYTTCINGKIIIGLIFDEDDNPYDYKDIFEELLNETLNIEKICLFEDEIEIENLLLTIFVDLRRYGEEFIEKSPEIQFHYQESYTKIFLFGIDDVGKSSLVKRIKSDEFNNGYYVPAKKFNIDYYEEKDKGLLAFWDMPGHRAFRNKWLVGFQNSNFIIFMIDIANQLRFKESKEEFWKIINRNELEGIPLIILANKVDLLNNSLEIDDSQYRRLEKEIKEYFEFGNIRNRKWKLMFTSVKTNFNVDAVIGTIFEFI